MRRCRKTKKLHATACSEKSQKHFRDYLGQNGKNPVLAEILETQPKRNVIRALLIS